MIIDGFYGKELKEKHFLLLPKIITCSVFDLSNAVGLFRPHMSFVVESSIYLSSYHVFVSVFRLCANTHALGSMLMHNNISNLLVTNHLTINYVNTIILYAQMCTAFSFWNCLLLWI